MDIIQTSNNYLNTLYQKSKDNLGNGYSAIIIAKLLGLSRTEVKNVMSYLSEKDLVDTKSGFGNNIKLTAKGIDYVVKLRENRVFKSIKFKKVRYLESSLDGIEFLYYYDVIQEDGKSEGKTIKVSISGSLSIGWGFQIWSMQPAKDYPNLAKMLLQVGKDKIIEKLKEGTLTNNEEIMLLTSTHTNTAPYDPDNLIEPENAEYEIEVGQKMLSEEIKENKLAAAIIETRDNINAVFRIKNKVKLLLLDEERNLLDFFKSANSLEEFSHRISSLGHISRHINEEILRELTNETDKKIKSVQLLKIFLELNGKRNENIINTLSQLGRIRQAYPNHSDIKDAVQGLAYFNINYPVENYDSSWSTLLKFYLTALKELYNIIAEIYLTKEK